jgi:hypothetical protein
MGLTMNHETAVSSAKEIADRVLAPAARQNDKEGRFSSEAIKALGPPDFWASCCRPTWAVPLSAPHVRGDRQRACRSGRIGRHGLSHARLRRRDDRCGAQKRHDRANLERDRRRATFVDACVQ